MIRLIQLSQAFDWFKEYSINSEYGALEYFKKEIAMMKIGSLLITDTS